MNRAFQGVWIPKEIYLDQSLSWTEKILLVEIGSLDQGEGCFAGNEYLAEFLRISEGEVANKLTKLRKLGYIIDRRFDGRKRYISLKAGFRKTLRQGSGKPEGRVQENLNHNNIDNNTKNILLGLAFELWNQNTTGKNLTGVYRNTKAGIRLLPQCRKITPPIETAFKKLNGYTEEDVKTAITNYILEIIDRNPANDYANHRFSFYEFFKQANGFTKYINK